jgi:hypothetical protein
VLSVVTRTVRKMSFNFIGSCQTVSSKFMAVDEYFKNSVCRSNNLPSGGDGVFFFWPARSPDLSVWDFILWPGLVKWDLWWTKWRRGRFSPSTSVSPAIHSTKFSTLTTTRGRYNRPVSGRRAEWTQFGLHPPLCKLKKINFLLWRYLKGKIFLTRWANLNQLKYQIKRGTTGTLSQDS